MYSGNYPTRGRREGVKEEDGVDRGVEDGNGRRGRIGKWEEIGQRRIGRGSERSLFVTSFFATLQLSKGRGRGQGKGKGRD